MPPPDAAKLQAYLDLLNNKLNGPAQTLPPGMPASMASLFTTSGDEKPYYRAEMKALNASLGAALARTTDRPTRAHIEGARDTIARILDPKFAPPATPSAAGRAMGIADGQETSCWPDYAITPE